MDVIACHTDADWDALGCLIVARKIYPGAAVVMPQPQTVLAGHDVSTGLLRSLNVRTPEDIDAGDVKRLVLVATRRPDAIGSLIAIADDPSIELHLYDNHPGTPEDLEGTLEVAHPTGACVTIVTQILADRDLKLMPEEATWALLGLFEKTGGLTLPNTTPEDIRVAAQLLEWGANLEMASEARRANLPAEQVVVLSELLHDATHWRSDQTDVVIAEAAIPATIGDVEALVRRLHRLSGADTTFALLPREQVVTFLGFSHGDGLDLGAVATEFEGNGEPARLHLELSGWSPKQVREKLREILPRYTRRTVQARDLLGGSAQPVSSTMTAAAAQRLFIACGASSVLVIDDQRRPLAIVTPAIVNRAVHHKLGEQPLTSLIVQPPVGCRAEDDIDALFEIATATPQPLYPVMQDGALVGVLRRETILETAAGRHLREHRGLSRPSVTHQHRESLARPLAEAANEDMLAALGDLGRRAADRGTSAMLVGGFVRDLILRRPNLDLDVVVEGDAASLANDFAAAVGGRVTEHDTFGTATVHFGDAHLDIATARREYYAEPAALPEVEPASLAEDIHRRDFTINTLLLDLHPDRFGNLVDLVDGLSDLRRGQIKVLHGLSFVEDPTRLLRALRFAARFGFELDPGTAALLDRAVADGYVQRLAGSRIWKELALILCEDDPTRALTALFERGVLPRVHPSLVLDQSLPAAFGRAKTRLAWYAKQQLPDRIKPTTFWLALLMLPLTDAEKAELGQRLALPEPLIAEVIDLPVAAAKLVKQLRDQIPEANSALSRLMRKHSATVAMFAAAMVDHDSVYRAARQFFGNFVHTRTELTGDDLAKMGLEPGPLFGEILDEVRDARLDGEVTDKRDELLLAKRIWQRKQSAK